MNIKSATKKCMQATYGDDSFRRLLEQLREAPAGGEHRLILFNGKPEKAKQKARQQIAENTGLQPRILDANMMVTKVEPETFKNIEHELSRFKPAEELLYIKNGERMNGSYTGYSNSKVKYATPQERYFFRKMQDIGGVFVVDLHSRADGGTTLRRAAYGMVNFPVPRSLLKKWLWNLTHITVNGNEIRTRRPKRGGKPSGNFK